MLVLAIIGSLVSALYFYYQYTKTKKLLSSASVNEVQQLLRKVGRHIELPIGEEPTLATVSDITKLSGQPFFARAKNGDRVIIYPRAKKAILYRQEIDKIIEVGPINVDDTSNNQVAGVTTTSQPVKIALYNGTTTVGLTKRAESSLQKMSSLKTEIIAKENASKDTYATSLIVDLTGKHASIAKQLAEFAKGNVGTLPEGELKPSGADILIILGASYVNESTPTNTPTPTE